MKIQIHPSKGIDDLRFGMKFEAAVQQAARYGEAHVQPAMPPPSVAPDLPPRPPKAVVTNPDFEVVLQAEDHVHLTVLEVYRPVGPTASEVTVDYDGMDVFRTPARDWTEHLRERGREAVWEDDEHLVVPGETLVVSRDTGMDVEVDPRDGLALYPSFVLVGPKNYYERADAWLNGEAQYTDEE